MSGLVLFVYRCVVSPIATNPVSATGDTVREPVTLISPVLLAVVGSQERRCSSLGNDAVRCTNMNGEGNTRQRLALNFQGTGSELSGKKWPVKGCEEPYSRGSVFFKCDNQA